MKAISPVIATVIIVAVTIAIAIAVALWMTGLVGSFTATENLQVINAYAEQRVGGWLVTIQVRNVGTVDVTVDGVYINGRPHDTAGATLSITLPYSIKAGETKSFTITLSNTTFTSGQLVEVRLHSASGKEYPKMVTLP